MYKSKALILGFAVTFSSGIFAHTDEYLDTVSAPHGGQLRMAGATHYELVIKPDALQVFVTDHAGTPLPVKDATGSAIVLGNTQKQTITLQPKSDNLLEGTGTFDPAQPVKAVVKIQLPGQETQQALFNTSKSKPHEGHEGHSH